MGKGSKPQSTTTQSTSSTTKAHPVVEQAAGDLIGGTMGLVLGSQWDPRTGKQIAGFSDPQLQAFADINQGIAQPYIDAAANAAAWGSSPLSAETIASYYSPYLNDVINATQADFDRSNQRQLGQVTGNARIAGSLGGDREAVVKALTAREQASTQNPIIANMRQQGYNTAAGLAQADAARALQGSGVLQNLANTAGLDTMWRLQSGQLQQGLTQAQLDALSQNAAAQGAFDWQKYLTGAGIIGGLGGVMGSTTNSTGTSQTTGPKPDYLSQALGLGIASAPYWGSIATGVGSAASGAAAALPFLAFRDGGRIGLRHGMAAGGTPGFYIPSAALQPSALPVASPMSMPSRDDLSSKGQSATPDGIMAGLKALGEYGRVARAAGGAADPAIGSVPGNPALAAPPPATWGRGSPTGVGVPFGGGETPQSPMPSVPWNTNMPGVGLNAGLPTVGGETQPSVPSIAQPFPDATPAMPPANPLPASPSPLPFAPQPAPMPMPILSAPTGPGVPNPPAPQPQPGITAPFAPQPAPSLPVPMPQPFAPQPGYRTPPLHTAPPPGYFSSRPNNPNSFEQQPEPSGTAPSSPTTPRLTMPGLPYLARGGRADRDLSDHMGDIAKAARSGRQAMASGGTPAGFYIPTAQLPTVALQPSGGAGMPMGTPTQPTTSSGDAVSAFKTGTALIKGLGEAGKGFNTTTDKNGWTTSVDYGDPIKNFTSGIGSLFGYGRAEGGGVDDDMPPLSGVSIVEAQPNLGVGLPVDSGNPQDELRRRIDAVPVAVPITDMNVKDVPNAGVAVPPPSITGDAVGSPGNPTGGVGMRPSPTPPPAAAPQSKAPFDDLGSTLKGWWDWSQGKEGAEVLGRIGVGMINAGQRGIAPLGAFGEGLGSGLDAKSAFQKSQRDQAVEKRKMELMEAASRIKAAEEGRAVAMEPYARQIAQAKIDAAKQALESGKYIPVDPTKRLLNAKTGEWVKGTGDQDALAQIHARKYAESTPKLMAESAAKADDARSIVRTADEMKKLAQHMYTGAWADQRLELAKIGRLFGLDFDPTKIANSEQYRGKIQDFVLAAAAKLKPLSDSDVKFVEKGLPGLARDPLTINQALDSLQRMAERNTLIEKYRQDAYRQGRPPDNAAIEARVDKELPGPGQTTSTSTSKSQPSPSASGIAGASQAAPITDAKQAQSKMQALPDGSLVSVGGKVYVKRGDKIVPAPQDSYSQGLFGGPYDAKTHQRIPTF